MGPRGNDLLLTAFVAILEDTFESLKPLLRTWSDSSRALRERSASSPEANTVIFALVFPCGLQAHWKPFFGHVCSVIMFV